MPRRRVSAIRTVGGQVTRVITSPVNLETECTAIGDGKILVGAATTGVATARTMSGDVTINNTGVTDIANSGVTAGSYGSSTSVGTFTVAADGRLTVASNVAIAFPAQTSYPPAKRCEFRLVHRDDYIDTDEDTAGTINTVYDLPFVGNVMPLYYSGAWIYPTHAGATLSLSGKSVGMYDIFAYWDGSDIQWEFTSWTDNSNRASAVTRLNGVWVKSSDNTRRLRGSIYIHDTGLSKFNLTHKYLSNVESLKMLHCIFEEATQHNYSTATIRSWRGDSAHRMELVISNPYHRRVFLSSHSVQSSNTVASVAYAGFGFDSSSQILIYGRGTCPSNTAGVYWSTDHNGSVLAATGLHTFYATEYGNGGAATDTFHTLRGELRYFG